MFDFPIQTALSEAPPRGLQAIELVANVREPALRLRTAAPGHRRPRMSKCASDTEFKRLYDAHFQLVWRALSRLRVSETDLMDLTQKVFLTAYLKLPEFEGRSQLSTWLWAICRRVAFAHRRSGAMRYEVATDPGEVAASMDQRSGASGELYLTRQVAAERMLGKLTQPQRIVFTLSEVDDLDGPQIAALLRISLGTVRSRLRAARERIRREVQRLTIASAFTRRKRK